MIVEIHAHPVFAQNSLMLLEPRPKYCLPKTTGSWSGDSKSYWGHQSLRPPFPRPKQELGLSATWELAIKAYHTSVGTCGYSAAKIKLLYCSRPLLEVCNVHFCQVPSDDDLLQYEWRLMGCIEGYRVAISHITGKEFSLDTPHVGSILVESLEIYLLLFLYYSWKLEGYTEGWDQRLHPCQLCKCKSLILFSE